VFRATTSITSTERRRKGEKTLITHVGVTGPTTTVHDGYVRLHVYLPVGIYAAMVTAV
jgi:hypothetical protein